MHALEWLTTRPARAGLIILALTLPCIGTARAQPADAREDAEKPWSKGIPVEQRQSAREIFLAGNKLFNEALFGKAAEKYKEALALLPHPFIYYNLAVAQINLGQHLEAYQSLQSALQYGAEHLGQSKHQQAQSFLAMLEKQLARIEVVCAQPGARVTLDGRILFDGPGTHEELVYAGEHQLVATRPGRVPATERVVLAPGQRVRVELDPLLPDRIETERYMPAWAPWAGMGVGVALISAGGYLDWTTSRKVATYNQMVNTRCPRGCPEVEVPDLIQQGKGIQTREHATAGLYIAGGAALVGSAVMVYVNRERVVRAEARPGSVSVAPTWGPRSAGFAVTGQF